MTRLARLVIAGQLHHVIQRGNNGQRIFGTAADRGLFLATLAAAGLRFGLAVHAYVLMENHFHLLVTPPTPEALPNTMQALGRRYVHHFNRSMGRTGTLWEGRYRSTIVQPSRYLLACMVYMDLNPVRSGLVEHAADYAWSSHCHYAGLRNDRFLSPPSLVWELGNTPFARESAYRDLVQAGQSRTEQLALTESAMHGWALGDADFVAALQRETPRRLRPATPGRPSKPRSA